MELEAGVLSYLPAVSENPRVQVESGMMAAGTLTLGRDTKPGGSSGRVQLPGEAQQVSMKEGFFFLLLLS